MQAVTSKLIYIMKKLLFTILAGVALMATNLTDAKAQTYKTGLGLGLDFGDGATFVGPQIKHFFNANSAGTAEVLFANGSTNLNLLYQYHGPIRGAAGLQWYAGIGPGLYFYDGGTDFSIKPMAGIDFKIPGAPLDFGLDWRPTVYFGEYDTDFIPGRFGLGFRFTF